MINKFLSIILILVAISCASIAEAAKIGYVVTSNPWGQTTNQTALNTAFGAGNWDQLTYSTAWAVMETYDVLITDGGDGQTTNFINFVNTNRGNLETFVTNGGVLFLNAARWYDSSNFNLGFNATLIYGPSWSSQAVNPSHTVCVSPNGAAGSSWTGSYFAHDYVTGTDIQSIIVGANGQAVFGEKTWGAGRVFFGGMTTDNFHSPQPQARILRANIYSYVAAAFSPPPTNTAPVANAGQDQVIEQANSGGTQVTLDGSGSSDADQDPLTYTWTGSFGSVTGVNPSVDLPLGISNITLVVNDGTVDSTSDSVAITVQDTTAPSITAPNVTVEQTDASGTTVNLSASVSDICDANPTVTNDAPVVFPLGDTTVTWTATDASGNSATASQTVTVVDTTAPELSIIPSSATLWPPNHKYVTVSVGITVSDVCDTDVANKVKLISVTSDEADEVSGAANKKGGGDGNTPVDIVIVNKNTVQLRAERLGGGDGRVYTLNYSVADASGNTTTASATVSVPKEEGYASINSGVHYTVTP